MNNQHKCDFIKKLGYYAYYNKDYWVNEKFGSDVRDHTNYGMSLEDAYRYETDKEFSCKVDDGMDFHHRSVVALSNLGQK